MRAASFFTSSIDLTTLTPPALPRPPAWICAFTTQTGPPSACAALTASSTVNAAIPRGTGTPNSRNTALAWYSWMFIELSYLRSETADDGADELFPEVRRDLLASVHQSLHRGGRFLKHVALRAAHFDLDDPLDAFGSDHHRHADVKILDAVLAVEPGRARQDALLVAQIAF